MNSILCEYVNKNEFDAGNKARSDALNIVKDLGYDHIPLFRSGESSKIKVFFQLIRGSLQTVFTKRKGENVMIQYPYYPGFVNTVLFAVLAFGKKIKKYELTLLIHDVFGLRYEKFDTDEGKNVMRKELERMQIFDRIICHNERMYDLFNSVLPSDTYKILGPFDYLYDKPIKTPEYMSNPTVIIAGNLRKDKSGYVYDLVKLSGMRINLYGMHYEGKESENVSYKGKFPPDELIEHLEGNFGLVWDGESLETCTGIYGRYLKYNNPHKFSLYLAAGIPVIVWSQSALADYVKKNNVGLCVENLEELGNIFSKLQKKDYEQMTANVLKVREEIISGAHLKNALK